LVESSLAPTRIATSAFSSVSCTNRSVATTSIDSSGWAAIKRGIAATTRAPNTGGNEMRNRPRGERCVSLS
jgi:hypothetical protein